MATGGAGTLIATAGAALEQIYLNFSDPNTEVDGEFASLQAPHPFLSDRQCPQGVRRRR